MVNDLHDLANRLSAMEAKVENLEDEKDRARDKLHKLSGTLTGFVHFPAVIKDFGKRISSLERTRSWVFGIAAGIAAMATAAIELLKSLFTNGK
jgi:uncharacterized membrane protein YdfJ with MMPL/SSD domain